MNFGKMTSKKENRMSWEKNIRKVVPYVPGEQPKQRDIIKLNTNENPYPPSPKVLQAVEDIQAARYRLYPDPDVTLLRQVLADYHGLTKEQVFVGVGSDDVLSMAFLTFFNSEKPILFPDITYSFYEVWADLYRIPYETRALRADFTIDPKDYTGENGGVIFPNPNAPTGILESLDTVEEIIKANPDVIVIVDEAYIDFGGVSALELLEKYDNLCVVRTFSKSRSLAGMRIGYAMGSEKLISYLNDSKFSFNSYTMNHAAIYGGAASVADEAYFREKLEAVISVREWTKQELKRLDFVFADSMTNFIFASHKTISAQELFEMLRESGIFVRHFKKPRIDNYLRISIGTKEEMETLIKTLEQYIKNRK